MLYCISRVARKSCAEPQFSTAIRSSGILIPTPRRRRQHNFSFPAKRRREIVLHARYVRAAETEDFSRWLIAWVWHNPKAKDQVWSVTEAAKSMGRKISEAEASAVTEEASITRKRLTADNLARFLGVTYAQRQTLRLTTIGSVNVGKRARKELRKRQDRLAKEAKRRVAGMRPQSESLSATKPWRGLGISRAAWYRRNKARRKGETTLSAALFICSEDRTVSTGLSEQRCRAEEIKIKKELPSSQTATTVAADRYVTAHSLLPLALRLLALGLKAQPGGPRPNVITADDPRMVARMAANGGAR
jgi:hypothetical protein